MLTDELNKAMDRVIQQLDSSQVVGALIERALWFFEECPEDFCVQLQTGGGVVFGGTNRVTWTPTCGLWPEPSYCTSKFLKHAANRM